MVNVKKLLTKMLAVLSASKLTSTDLNQLTTGFENQSFNHPEGSGVWYVSGVSNASPTGNDVWGMLFQMRSPKSVHPATADAVYAQIFIHVNGRVYSRAFNNGAWTAWKLIATEI